MIKLKSLLRGAFVLFCFSQGALHAQPVSAELEVRLVTGVGFVPQAVALENTYVSAVPICTYNLPSPASPPVVPRITNITATSFSLSIQSLPNTDPGVTGNVHCLIAEEGTHTLPDGRQFQAITQVVSDVLGLSAGNFEETTNISALVAPGFTDPIALGAVISSNDARASAFHGNDCESRNNEPFASGLGDGICVGHHIGQLVDSPAYAPETVGVIIVDQGSGASGLIAYEIARGPNSIDGVGNGGGNTYAVGGDFDIGIATQAGENGGQGGWAVLVGADPLPNNQFNLAIEEEDAAGDITRRHTNEVVDYWIFRNLPAPELAASKTVVVFDPQDEGLFAVPGNDVLYTITLANNGAGLVDEGTLFFVDALPPEMVFFNGDADGPGPGIGAVIFEDQGSGLTFNPATDVAFAVTLPATFDDCTHLPTPGFDAAIRFVCFRPQGGMLAGAGPPTFSLTFRARLQ